MSKNANGCAPVKLYETGGRSYLACGPKMVCFVQTFQVSLNLNPHFHSPSLGHSLINLPFTIVLAFSKIISIYQL